MEENTAIPPNQNAAMGLFIKHATKDSSKQTIIEKAIHFM